jgi:hypothetical protein
MTAAAIRPLASKKVSFSRALMAAGIAIVGSVIANLIVRWIGMLLVPVNADFVPLATWQPTAVMTTLFLVVATIVFLIVNAFTANPPRVYNIVALIALVVSLIPNVMMLLNPAGVTLPNSGPPTTGAAIILMIQHVVAYAITVWSFTKWAQRG